jgi:hypothetical protein
MRIKVSPSELNIEPILVGGISIIIVVLGIVKQTGLGHGPFVSGKQDQVSTAAVHLI